ARVLWTLSGNISARSPSAIHKTRFPAGPGTRPNTNRPVVSSGWVPIAPSFESPIIRNPKVAAARHVPLRRQSLDVSLLTTAESRVHPRTGETTRLISHGWVRIVPPFAHARDVAAPRARLKPRLGTLPLKRQSGVSLLTRAESRVYPRTG